MTHSIDTAHAPHKGFGGLSNRQLVEIIIGIAIVAVLVIAAVAYVNNAETSVDDVAVPSELQTVPQVQSVAGVVDPVSHGVADPFETQFVSPQVAAAVAGEPSDVIAEGPAYPRPEFR